jgi:hypothetical protein
MCQDLTVETFKVQGAAYKVLAGAGCGVRGAVQECWVLADTVPNAVNDRI